MQFLRAFGLILLGFIFFASQAEAKTDDKTKDNKTAQTVANQQQLVESVDFQGNRRFRDEDLLYYIKTRPGDVYSASQLELDLKSILALDAFDKVKSKVLTEEGQRGGVNVIFQVEELPVIRDLQFKGLKAVPESVLQRCAESLCEELESISEVIRIYPLKSETSPFRAFAANKPQQMPRHAAIRS